MSGEAKTQMKVLQCVGQSCLQIDEIAHKTALSRHRVSAAACALITRGLLERTARGCYELTEHGQHCLDQGMILTSGPYKPHPRPHRPKKNTLRQRAWNVMRMKGNSPFTVEDIAVVAAQDGDTQPLNNMRRYLTGLQYGGYLMLSPYRKAGVKPTSNGLKKYVLIKNTGPVAPVLRPRKREIYDHNLREAIGYE